MADLNYSSALSCSAGDNIYSHDASALSHVFPSNLPEPGPERQLEPQRAAGPSTEFKGRELYSKEQWEDKKWTIWHLYNIEKNTYKRVVEILRTEHEFYPTYV